MGRSVTVSAVVASVCALVVAGCSSSTKGTGSGAGTTSTTTSATSPASTGTAPDEAKLQSLLLTQADVPAGWTGAPSENDPSSSDEDEAKLAACLGIPDTSTKHVAEADSDDYSKDDSTISSSARSFSSQGDIDQDVRGLTSSKASECFKQVLKDASAGELPSGATLNSFDVTVSPGANGGPSNVVAVVHAKAEVTASGQHVSLFVDAWYIKGNLIEADVDFTGIQQPIDAAAQSKAVNAVAQRIAAA